MLCVWVLSLCDPMYCSPPGSFVQGIFQVRILEWVAISFSRRLPDPGMEPMSLVSPALVGILHHLGRFLKVKKVLQGGVAMNGFKYCY